MNEIAGKTRAGRAVTAVVPAAAPSDTLAGMQEAGPRFDVCGFTQLLVPAFFMAFAVASLTSSDAFGWMAAVMTAGAIAVARQLRGTATTCALPSASSVDHRATIAEPGEPERSSEPERSAR